MRIGLIAPPWVPVPPPGYGGTEVVVGNLARGLARRGHDVRLFTVGESRCPVPTRSRYAAAVEPMGAGVPEAAHVLAAYQELSDAGIIHDHTRLGPLIAARRWRTCPPAVTTNHGPFTPVTRRIFAEIARHAAIVAISRAQARAAGGIPIAAVIHHGVDLDMYQPGPGGGGCVLFAGRMSADKRAHRAVRIAARAGRKLIIVTRIREPAEKSYYEQKVRPLLPPEDDLLDDPPLPDRLELMRNADALVSPISWPEPSGLVMAEALASATPVLAFPRGAAPEIVDDGKTGYLCKDEDEMVTALGKVTRPGRVDCRAAAERRFSLHRMVTGYERLYRAILATGGVPSWAWRAGFPARSVSCAPSDRPASAVEAAP
jgi:glycosyltransferase involved in cell wall biosynthesis